MMLSHRPILYLSHARVFHMYQLIGELSDRVVMESSQSFIFFKKNLLNKGIVINNAKIKPKHLHKDWTSRPWQI